MSTKSIGLVVVVLALAGGIAGFLVARNAKSADLEVAQKHAIPSHSFWKLNDPEQWRNALMKPVVGQSPSNATGEELVIMARHIESISTWLSDAEIPEGSRFELGAGVFGLATVALNQKGKSSDGIVSIPEEKVPVIVQTALKGLKVRYDIARRISPPDALANVYFASTITGTRNNPAGLVEALKEHHWNVHLQEATVALHQPQ